MTPEQRDALTEELMFLERVEKPLSEAMEPFRNALDQIQGLRETVLERYGVEGEIIYCEADHIILPGDKYHVCDDGPYLCEACAPTRGYCLAQLRERNSEPLDDEEAEELRDAIASLEALTPEQLEEKAVVVYAP